MAEPASRVVLVGMMGSGKSTIGRLLSGRTGWPFHDNDALLEQATGVTARALLVERGEAALREAESAALALGLRQPAPCIVAAAAGTVTGAAGRALLAGASVVWLAADPPVLAPRAPGGAHRPWLEGDAEAWLRETLAERAPLYQSVANLVVDVARPPQEIVDDIVGWLRESGAGDLIGGQRARD